MKVVRTFLRAAVPLNKIDLMVPWWLCPQCGHTPSKAEAGGRDTYSNNHLQIRRACRSHNIRVAFRSGRTIQSLLTRVKDLLPVGQQSIVVYQIPCSCGKVYIGKTIRRLETRLKEHKDACCKGFTSKSACGGGARVGETAPHQVEGDNSTGPCEKAQGAPAERGAAH